MKGAHAKTGDLETNKLVGFGAVRDDDEEYPSRGRGGRRGGRGGKEDGGQRGGGRRGNKQTLKKTEEDFPAL